MAATAAAAVYATISRGRMPRMEGPPSHPNFRSNTVNGKVRRSGSGGGFLSFPVLVSTLEAVVSPPNSV